MVVEGSRACRAAELGTVADLPALLLRGACRSLDVDPGAVHVHFAIANLVEPSPGEEGSTGRSVAGNGEVVIGSQWAATDNTLDDTESFAIIVRE